MKLYTVGVGGPPPSSVRFGSSFVLEIQNEHLMVDCGPATTYKMARLGLFSGQISTLFITHHHFDHNADLPCLVLTRWDHRKEGDEPLRIYGPAPTADFTEKLFGETGAFRPDLLARINHPASQNLYKSRGGLLPRKDLELVVEDIDSGSKVVGKNWEALCTEVHHIQPWLTSYAYRINTSEGSVVFTGDAGSCREMKEIVQGADVWVTGCAAGKDRKTVPHLADVSSGTEEIAEDARDGGVKKVIVTHMLASATSTGPREEIAIEISKGYDGPVLVPAELEILTVP